MLTWMALGLGSALAEPPRAPIDDSPEEIVVYGDDFARWDNTRWLVTSELVLPLPLLLGADDNISFFSYAMQTRMVLLCDKDGKQTKKRLEVMCEIEDVGIMATSVRRWKREKDRERVEAVLQEIDAKLTGAKIQMQVDFKGGVNNVDLEGLVANNQREREINETLRQLLLRVVSAFHMKIPDHAQRSGQWYEYNSNLMKLPSVTAPRGSTTMAHTVSRHNADGYQYQLVQTLGQGTVAVNLPNFNASNPGQQAFGSDSATSLDGGTGGVGSNGGTPDPGGAVPVGNSNFAAKELDVEATYKIDHTGVAVFERDSGIMTERVWSSRGTPTASSAGGTLNNVFLNVGRIKMLGQGDVVDVGRTGQVAWPFHPMEGLPNWVSIEEVP